MRQSVAYATKGMNVSHNRVNRAADLRVQRTRKLLQEAFKALVVEAGFDAITIQMLADRALVNRATFYRHYQDKYDLAEQVYNTLTADYLAAIAGQAVADPLRGWELLFVHVASHAEFYLALLSGVPHFRDYVCRNIEQELLAGFQAAGLTAATAVPPPLVLRYLATAQMGVVQWWLENGQQVAPRQMAQYLWQLHAEGAFRALQLPLPVPHSGLGGK
jgi:AcrR family transcriptional regulator